MLIRREKDACRFQQGGWGCEGTMIFLPLGPNHLLFTQVGKKPPLKGTRLEKTATDLVRRWIVEHAHRMIICDRLDSELSTLRPRKVDEEMWRKEKQSWEAWHAEQSAAEIDIRKPKDE
jgi:hypothetical protein